MQLLNKHVTIRKFSSQVIPDKIIEEIVFSGTRASTTGNMQLYSVIITKEQKNIRTLAAYHFNQSVALNAPVLLTVVADFNRFSLWCKYSDADPGYDNFLSFFTSAIDAMLFAQNICIAAENKGLGICYLGTTTYNAREIIDFLKIPRLCFPVTTIALGYPDEIPPLTDRLPFKSIIHNEFYEGYTFEKIKEIYQEKENLDDSRKYILENNKESLAQVFTDIRYTRKDNEFFSKKMIATLRDQGFPV